MRFFSVIFLAGFLIFTTGWENDFEQAKKKAETEHKYILLNFSGSDWCGPCIRLTKDVFESASFVTFSSGSLVLVNADFPRLKKNQLSKEQQKKNDKLADKYNSQGVFPLTLLLNEKGKIIKSWEGNPGLSTEQFISQIKSTIDTGN
ncbi:MAG: thioredoxin family protein [Chitinophagaceae bacterium]|nr:thioredoxin family protein [Chitinophagaceae bacterium]